MRPFLAIIFAAFLLTGCTEDGITDSQPEFQSSVSSEEATSSNDLFASKNGAMVEICHVPDGNTTNKQTLLVSASGAASHLKHGDVVGSCEAVPANRPPVVNLVTPEGEQKNLISIGYAQLLTASVSDPDGDEMVVTFCVKTSDNGTYSCHDIGTSTGLVSWSLDVQSSQYWWYVTVGDEDVTVTSSEWYFYYSNISQPCEEEDCT